MANKKKMLLLLLGGLVLVVVLYILGRGAVKKQGPAPAPEAVATPAAKSLEEVMPLYASPKGVVPTPIPAEVLEQFRGPASSPTAGKKVPTPTPVPDDILKQFTAPAR